MEMRGSLMQGASKPSGAADRRSLSMAVCLAGFGFMSLISAMTVWPTEQKTTQDALAEQEFERARPELARLTRLLQVELQRQLFQPNSPPSPEFLKLTADSSIEHPKLGDTRVPLHLRFIEWYRLELVAGTEYARTAAGHCDPPDISPSQLVDSSFRQHMHTVIQCRQEELDRYQNGLHKVNKTHADAVLELKLPSLTEKAFLAHARAETNEQDEAVESVNKGRRKLYQSMDDLLSFIDAHSNEVHFVNNQLRFETAATANSANELINSFMSAAKLAQ
jgi:hypothetical protein